MLNALLVVVAIGLSISGAAAAATYSPAAGDFRGGIDVGGRKSNSNAAATAVPTPELLLLPTRAEAWMWQSMPFGQRSRCPRSHSAPFGLVIGGRSQVITARCAGQRRPSSDHHSPPGDPRAS
jgi:hypothetical protein